MDRLGVLLLEACVADAKLASAFVVGIGALEPGRLAPGSMRWRIEIDPGGDAIPGRAVERDAVVAFLKHLHELGCVRVELRRIE